SRAALGHVCREFLVQDHLLIRSLMIAVAERAGDAVAQDIAAKQWIGAGAIAAARLHRALASHGDGVETIAAVLRLHPAFLPGYSGIPVNLGGERLRMGLGDCEALREGDRYTWSALLDRATHPALDAMVQAVNPQARCLPATPAGAERLAWDVVIDGAAAPAETPPEVAMVSGTNTARFAFQAGALSS